MSTDFANLAPEVVAALRLVDLALLENVRPNIKRPCDNLKNQLRHYGFSSYAVSDTILVLRRQSLTEALPKFVRTGDFSWTITLPQRFQYESDNTRRPFRSRLWLLENEVAIGPAHAQHDEIARLGRGRYSHWDGGLLFSASDNTDPNHNGYSYRIVKEYHPDSGRSAASIKADQTVDFLADILKSRDVSEIVYFHTDHFEPWYGSSEIDSWKILDRFLKLTERQRFGSRLSLFYTPFVVHNRRTQALSAEERHILWDGVTFSVGSREFIAHCREHLRPLEVEVGHEFHLHVHHEGWTTSDHVAAHLRDWMERRGSLSRDSRRLELYLRLSTAQIAEELGRPFLHWAFVHGNWALNASNPSYCRVADELEILRRHGCFGDFTFPAGDLHVDPRIEAPFTCQVLRRPRSYDVEATARPLWEGARDLARGRFLIWNSRIKGARSSLDYYDPANRTLFEQPEFLLRDWLAQSVVIKNCLYIKTHAHSLHELYRLWETGTDIPHTYPPVRQVFDLLERAAERARVPITPSTVNEVTSRLVAFDRGEQCSPPSQQAVGMQNLGAFDTVERDLRRAERLLFDAMPAFLDRDDGYYSGRVARGSALEEYEWAIVDFVRQNFDRNNVRLVEAGAGWGPMCLILAVLGYEVTAVTAPLMYTEVCQQLSEKLAAPFPQHRKHLNIVEGFFPEAFREDGTARNRQDVLIMTNIIHGVTHANEDRILAAASRFCRVILDLETFGINRVGAERERFLQWISQGFRVEQVLWRDRLLLLSPKTSAPKVGRQSSEAPSWLIGQRAAFPGNNRGDLSLLRNAFGSRGGHAWYVRLPDEYLESSDDLEHPNRSPWRLLEDGALLGSPHAMHDDISMLGHGRYSHWQEHLIFATSDNSDPNTNRRTYTLARRAFD